MFMSSLSCYSQQKIYFERFFAQVLNSMGFVKVSQYCERGKKMVVEIRENSIASTGFIQFCLM